MTKARMIFKSQDVDGDRLECSLNSKTVSFLAEDADTHEGVCVILSRDEVARLVNWMLDAEEILNEES